MSTGCTSSHDSSRASGDGAAAGAGAVSTGSTGLSDLLMSIHAPPPQSAAISEEREVRHAGDQAHHREQRRGNGQRLRLTEQLLRELAAHVLRRATCASR